MTAIPTTSVPCFEVIFTGPGSQVIRPPRVSVPSEGTNVSRLFPDSGNYLIEIPSSALETAKDGFIEVTAVDIFIDTPTTTPYEDSDVKAHGPTSCKIAGKDVLYIPPVAEEHIPIAKPVFRLGSGTDLSPDFVLVEIIYSANLELPDGLLDHLPAIQYNWNELYRAPSYDLDGYGECGEIFENPLTVVMVMPKFENWDCGRFPVGKMGAELLWNHQDDSLEVEWVD